MGDKMGIAKYNYQWNFFKQPSESLYYFLGFVAADGYVGDNDIEIGINQKDKRLLERFRDLIVPDKPLYYKKKSSAYILKISCRSKIKKFKSFYGMQTSKKCYEVQFPRDIPQKYYKDFIRGYIDGDGCIDTTKGYQKDRIYIGPRLRILGNHDFLQDMNEKTKEFVRHNTNAILKKGHENIYYVTYNFSTASKLLKWLYEDSTIYLSRKKDKVLELCS